MKNVLLPFILMMGFFTVTAQVGINTTEPDPSSALDVNSTSSGILIPRMTEAQRNAIPAPATGLMVFQTDNTPGFYYFEGTWKPLTGDTKWTASRNDIYNINSGNVGIGTTAPTTKLHVENSGSASVILDQGFEGGLAPMNTSGNQPWARQSSNPHSGTRSAKSGAIGGSQQSTLQYVATVPAGGASLSFWYKVSSEPNWDKFKFYLNGVEMGSWSGEVGYSQFVVSLTPGNHTLKWEYSKDGSVDRGIDAAFVDDVVITAAAPAALRLVDGNQGIGKVIVSDANGNARWEQLTNDNISDIPLITAFGGMVIPPCNGTSVGATGSYSITIKGVPTAVSWEVLGRITSAGSTVTINSNVVLRAPLDAERLQVRYNFNPPLPFPPSGLIFSANNNTGFPDTFSLNYAAKSQTSITMNITRTDKIGDTSSNCWQGLFYFDVFMMD